MLTVLDHVIVAVADLDAAAAEIEDRLGLPNGGSGRHDAHGTYNRIFWLRDSYVELMAVFDRAIAASSWWGAHIATLTRDGSDSWAGLAFATSDLDADVARLRELGSAISDPIDGQRVRPDGEIVRWRIGRLPAPDPETGLAFLIEHDLSAAEWRPEDRAARDAAGSGRLIRVQLPVENVAHASMRLLRDLGLQFRPSLAGGGARDSSVGAQTLRLLPARRDSKPVVVLRATSGPRELDLFGCHWSVLPLLD